MEGIMIMEYDSIIKRINTLENNDFTMDSFKEVGDLYQTINNIYGHSLLNKKIDAKTNYVNLIVRLNSIVSSKLKEKLGFEDEIINQIMSMYPFFSYILDIYVLDGNVIVRLKSHDNSKEISHLISKGFYDVSSKDFTRELNYSFYKEFFTDAMNNAMVPLFKEKMEKGKLLNINNKQIDYNLNNLNIYINKSLKEIMKINTDVNKEVAKVLIKHNHDELYYFDLKIHYAYFELAHNDYKVNKLSEILDGKVKVKKK